HYETARLPTLYIITGAMVMLVLGQASVLVPARRASNVPPVVATRSG
ncbi:MAG TPA: peptide ABC transporter permease, partial [Dyella sp.]|nr:peptide ABC transporter permease [Dyella sp.]